VSVAIVMLFPSLLKCLIVKVSYQAPYGTGVGSVVEVRTKNQTIHAVGSPAAASPLCRKNRRRVISELSRVITHFDGRRVLT
jgi:hypothetical protein